MKEDGMKFDDVTEIIRDTCGIPRSPKECIAQFMEQGLTRAEAKSEYNRHWNPKNKIWQSDKYVVHVDYPEGDGFIHLSIRNFDGTARHDWREFQEIKNTLVGKEYEAIELYPAESRLLDECNQYHLWVLPKGQHVPCGRTLERRVSNLPEESGTYQRGFDGVDRKNVGGEIVENSP
jgi:hypothetical protein